MLNILAILFLLFPAAALGGDVFKCVDKGKTIYSHEPCGIVSVFLEHDPASLALSPSVLSSKGSPVLQDSGLLHIPFDARRGGFFVDASIDGFGVLAQIDTGATSTAISSEIALRLDVGECVPAGVSQTANGVVSFCRVKVGSFIFGGFSFLGLVVAVHSGLSGVLIGNDVLNRLHMTQQNGVMTLSR